MTEFTVDTDKDDNLIVSVIPDKDENFKRDFDIMDLIDQLSDHDISIYVSHVDGWSYLYNAANDIVYWVTDHRFDKFRDLRELGEAIFPPHKNTYEYYEGYEWNDDRVWTDKEMSV